MKLERDIPLGAAAALALATACGEEPETPYVFPEAEPCAGVEVLCADAQSVDGESEDVTGVTEGVEDCNGKGWTVRVGARPVNAMKQNTEGTGAGADVAQDTASHDVVPREDTRSQEVTKDGSYTLNVPKSGDAFEFIIERYSPAAVQACDCMKTSDEAVTAAQEELTREYCIALGFKGNEDTGVSGKAQAQAVCYHGRPGKTDIQRDVIIAYDGTVQNPGRNSCLNVPIAQAQTRSTLMRSGTINRRMIPASKGKR